MVDGELCIATGTSQAWGTTQLNWAVLHNWTDGTEKAVASPTTTSMNQTNCSSIQLDFPLRHSIKHLVSGVLRMAGAFRSNELSLHLTTTSRQRLKIEAIGRIPLDPTSWTLSPSGAAMVGWKRPGCGGCSVAAAPGAPWAHRVVARRRSVGESWGASCDGMKAAGEEKGVVERTPASDYASRR